MSKLSNWIDFLTGTHKDNKEEEERKVYLMELMSKDPEYVAGYIYRLEQYEQYRGNIKRL